MRLKTTNPFPFTHPELAKTSLEWDQNERATLERAVVLLDEARDLVGPETDDGMDLGKASTILGDWL